MTIFSWKISPINLFWLRLLIHKPMMLRFYRHWRESLKREHSVIEDDFPWMVYEAVSWLESYLKPGMEVFEWGSGGSTLFFASRVHFVVTVEHDPNWYAIVSKQLSDLNIQNVHFVLCKPERTDLLSEIYTSTDERYKGLSFQHYAETIDSYPDNSFDLVVVDGRARPGCMKHAIPKIRPGGYLLLDNSDRESYTPGKKAVATWLSCEFYGPGPYNKILWSTTIWQKPESWGTYKGGS